MKPYTVISLGMLLNGEFDISKIEESFKKFSCQREVDLENFLLQKAIPYERTNFGKTNLLIDLDELDKGNFSIMAYYTIAQRAVDISKLPAKKKRKVLGEYPGRDSLNAIPAYLIGQLGRNDAYTTEELSGEQILNECYNSISNAAQVVGGNLVVLECREPMFERVYASKGFLKLYNDLNEEKLYTLYKKVDFTEYWNRYQSDESKVSGM